VAAKASKADKEEAGAVDFAFALLGTLHDVIKRNIPGAAGVLPEDYENVLGALSGKAEARGAPTVPGHEVPEHLKSPEAARAHYAED
jgi:hypothetical protein